MPARSLQDWLFELHPPHLQGEAWWFAVEGARRWTWGPYPDPGAADAAAHEVFQRWNAAARARGGWAWKATPRRWVMTLPRGCPVEGRPFVSEACTRHTAGRARDPPEPRAADPPLTPEEPSET